MSRFGVVFGTHFSYIFDVTIPSGLLYVRHSQAQILDEKWVWRRRAALTYNMSKYDESALDLYRRIFCTPFLVCFDRTTNKIEVSHFNCLIRWIPNQDRSEYWHIPLDNSFDLWTILSLIISSWTPLITILVHMNVVLFVVPSSQ